MKPLYDEQVCSFLHYLIKKNDSFCNIGSRLLYLAEYDSFVYSLHL